MSGTDPTGYGWLDSISVGDAVGAMVIAGHAVSYAILLSSGDSTSGAAPTSGGITTGSLAGSALGIGHAAHGLANAPSGSNPVPTRELGSGGVQGGLYNEAAGPAPPRAEGAMASSEVWTVHTLGTDYKEHVTTPEEAVAVTLIALAPLAWEGAAALLGIARGSYTIAMSVEQAAVVLRSAPAGYRTMAQFGQRLGWGRGANAVETALARANSITLAEAKALGISSRQSFLIRDAYRAVLNSAKGLKNGATSNPTALGREVLLNRVGQLLQGAGL